MAVLDPQHDTIVIRVVYDGPPMAGKTTSVRMLANGLGGKVIVPEEVAGRTLFFDWLDYTGGLFEGRRIRCQIVTVPGQATLASRRRHLLQSADVVVFVGDSQPNAQSAARSYFEGLRRVLDNIDGPAVGIVMQANKRDHVDAVPVAQMRDLLNTTDLRIAIVESIATEGVGIREAFVFAVRLALDRVRELMRLNLLKTAPPEIQTAQDLLSQLHRVEGDALKLAADSGLVHTSLSEVRATPIAVAAFDQALRDEACAPIKPVSRRTRASGEAAPALPNSRLPSGMIWPAVNGRLILHEAIADQVGVQHDASGDWSGTVDRWAIHSPAHAQFENLQDGRDALVNWARMHVASAQVTSDQRCIALAPDGADRYRLWQVSRIEASLRDRFEAALKDGPEPIAHSMMQLTRSLIEAADRWADAACWLPLSLRKIGISELGPRYLGQMPDPSRARPAERRSESNVMGLLAAELAFALPAIRSQQTEVLASLERIAAAASGEHADAARVFVRQFLRSM